MADVDKVFAGSITEIYDRYLVPLIFESYASDLAARVAEVKPRSVLEIAAGTGALTRALALRLPVEGLIAATDLNQAPHGYHDVTKIREETAGGRVRLDLSRNAGFRKHSLLAS